jgi:Flp pilus assembly protein TadD
MAKDGCVRSVPGGPARVLALTGVLIFVSGCATVGGSARETLADNAASPEQSLAQGDAAARRGDFERALVYYLESVGAKETADAWLRVGAACTRLGRSERALQAYLKVIELDPTQVDAHEEAGLDYLAIGDTAAAREQLTRALELDPARWRSQNGLGILADGAEDHAEAIGHYEAALKLNPKSAMVLNNLGYSRYLSGDYDHAARDLYAATQLDAGYKAAWSNLAMVYAHRGWYPVAIEILSKVADKATAYNDVGYIAFQRGDLEQSEQLLNEAIRLSPVYYETAHRNLRRVRDAMNGQEHGEARLPPRVSG